MLIDEDRVSIRVHSDEAGRPRCAFVRLLLQLYPLCLQLALQIADVGERGELLSVAVPAGEGENVLLKYPLKQPDRVIAVLQDQPFLRGIPGEDLKTEPFVEPPRSLDILDSQADRKRAKFHALLLHGSSAEPPCTACSRFYPLPTGRLRGPDVSKLSGERRSEPSFGCGCCQGAGSRYDTRLLALVRQCLGAMAPEV